MPNYTFHSLSDIDFEDMVCDLLGELNHCRFQRFTPGRDSGIDLLFGAGIHKGTIVQCKQFWRSGYSKLKSELKNSELPKLAKLKPARYIVATSVGLTPDNKQELLAILRPYCIGMEDIYGSDDLNTLLGTYPQIEQAHHKLWLTSVPVLQRILHQGKVVWNALTKSEIERKLSLYVQTAAYGRAMDILKEHNYCMISGIPGVGKTTLAQILTTRLMEDGFELIAVRDDIGEAFAQLDTAKRQVVYYDDFLGQASVAERLGKNEDRGILRLLQEAKRSKSLKVIFTTREYILNDAKRVYESLNGREFDIAKCVITVEDYTRARRAKILYNHIYFSTLPRECAVALVTNRDYKLIVDHKNYNPRIIEWMTSDYVAHEILPRDFISTFVRTLENPERIWEHAFCNQIGPDAQLILYCLASIIGMIAIDELHATWVAALHPNGQLESRDERVRFNVAMKYLDGAFLRTRRENATIAVDFHNPSIRDYVLHYIGQDVGLRSGLMTSCVFFEQLSCLVRLDKNGRIGTFPDGQFMENNAVRSAIKSSFTKNSPVLHFVSVKHTGKRALYRPPTDWGQRLTTLAKWGKVLGDMWIDFVCEIAVEQIDEGNLARIATSDVCGFLDIVIAKSLPDGGKWSALVKQCLGEVSRNMEDGYSTEDWITWSQFVCNHEEVFDAEARTKWQELATDFCAQEVDTILGNSDSPSDAEDWFGRVEELASIWGFALDAERQRVEDWCAEHSPDEDQEWNGERDWLRADGSEADADKDLDFLFGSLTQRDYPTS